MAHKVRDKENASPASHLQVARQAAGSKATSRKHKPRLDRVQGMPELTMYRGTAVRLAVDSSIVAA